MSERQRAVAVVTGANQGLGLALVEGLCVALGPEAIVYLTARSEERGLAAVRELEARGLAPRFALLDVSDVESIDRFVERIRLEHGGVDLFVSNATSRIVKDTPFAEQVRPFVTTANLATTRLLARVGPLLRDRGRFLVVASGFGRLQHLPEALWARFDRAESLAAIDEVMLAYVEKVERGTAAEEGWPTWINIPSKVGQVAATRLYAREHRAEAERRGQLIAAVCPGLVDTGASRPWFADMSKAQTPEAAAKDVIWLATAPRAEVPFGELVQHREILSWYP